jgi:integrase
MRNWWNRAEKLAGLANVKGLGWHGLRRKFATDLQEAPLKLLCELGGWKEPQTLLKCYQHPDEGALREALARRERRQAGGET